MPRGKLKQVYALNMWTEMANTFCENVVFSVLLPGLLLVFLALVPNCPSPHYSIKRVSPGFEEEDLPLPDLPGLPLLNECIVSQTERPPPPPPTPGWSDAALLVLPDTLMVFTRLPGDGLGTKVFVWWGERARIVG